MYIAVDIVQDVKFRLGKPHCRAEDVLDDADSFADVRQRLFVERYRQQVVGVQPRHSGPAEMVGDRTQPTFNVDQFAG